MLNLGKGDGPGGDYMVLDYVLIQINDPSSNDSVLISESSTTSQSSSVQDIGPASTPQSAALTSTKDLSSSSSDQSSLDEAAQASSSTAQSDKADSIPVSVPALVGSLGGGLLLAFLVALIWVLRRRRQRVTQQWMQDGHTEFGDYLSSGFSDSRSSQQSTLTSQKPVSTMFPSESASYRGHSS